MDSIKKLYSTLFQHSLKRTIYVIGGLIVALSLPITIILTQQQQDLRQRATFNNYPYTGGEGGITDRSCLWQSERANSCSCTSNSQCLSKNCTFNKCQPNPTATLTPTTPPSSTLTPTPTRTPTNSPSPTGTASCSSFTNKPASCTCYLDYQCASGKCNKTSTYSGTCSGPSISPSPSPSTSCGLTNRSAGCACEQSTQCQSGLTCTNNSCSGANPLSPTPTNGANETRILLSVSLPGISNRTGSAAASPKRIARETKVEIYNSSNQKVSDKTGNLIYDTASKLYKGTISLGDGFTTGQYIVKVRMDNSLWRRVPGIVTITANTDNNPTQQIQLVTGDLDQNNSLTVIDYTNFVKCFKDESTCTSAMKILADLDDDGTAKDDLDDLTILQKGFAVRDGD